MTDDASIGADLDALARDYLDAWRRHLAETARQAELPVVIGRLYARTATDPTAFVRDIDAWNEAWRAIVEPVPHSDEDSDKGGTDDPPIRKGGAGDG